MIIIVLYLSRDFKPEKGKKHFYDELRKLIHKKLEKGDVLI